MRLARSLTYWIGLAVAAALLVGCSRDARARARVHYQKGEAYFQQGKFQEGVIEFSNAVQLDKEYAAAHYGLARCYLKMGSYPAAYVELARTVELAPETLDAHVDAAVLLLASGAYDDARRQVEAVLSANPKHVEAHIVLANVFASDGEMGKAFQEIDKAIALDPNRPSTVLNLAILQGSAGQLATAETTYKRAIAMDPKSIVPLMAMGEFYEQVRHGSEAEDVFRRAMALAPTDPRPREALVRVYLEQNKASEAEKFLLQAVEQHADLDSMRQLANFYIRTGDLWRATFRYGAIRLKYPADLPAKKYYIQLLILEHRLLEAEKLNDEVLDANPRDSECLVLRAQLLLQRKKPQEASDLLERLLQGEPENALAHHYLGMALSATNDTTRAEAEFREATRLSPGLLESQQMLAQMALKSQNYALLEQSVTQLINALPSSPRWYVYRAMAAIEKGDLKAAEMDLQRAIQVSPQNPLAYSKMGLLRRRQERRKEAAEFFEKALQRDPAYFEALQGLAEMDMDQKQADAALARVQAQIAKVPHNTHFYFLLGSLYLRLGEKVQAESAFKSAVAADGANVDALLLLAELFYARGATESAAGAYEQAIRTNPNDPRAYVLLGSIQQFRGNPDRAEELYQKALRVRPDFPMAANNLAFLMLERGGNLDMAASLAQVAHKGMPDSSQAADTLGYAYYKKGAYGLAIDLLEEAVRKDPNDPNFQYHLGMAYQGAHDRERARVHLQKVLQLNPQYSHADEIQQILKLLQRG